MRIVSSNIKYLKYKQRTYFCLLHVLERSAFWKCCQVFFSSLIFEVQMSYIETESPDKPDKKVAARPKVSVMVDTAIKTLAEPKGSSLRAITKYINANYSVDIQKLSPYIKRYLKNSVERGDLVKPKGKGAAGSFKINKQKAQVKPKAPEMKLPKPLKMQTSTPKKVSKPKKVDTKSPNKSPVEKMKLADLDEIPADATFSKPKTKTARKSRVSLLTKPRKSLVSLPAKVKKPKKLMSKKVNQPKVSISPRGKSENSITSPKLVKIKGAAKSTKAKKSPKPGKPPLIPKKAASKKAPARDGQK